MLHYEALITYLKANHHLNQTFSFLKWHALSSIFSIISLILFQSYIYILSIFSCFYLQKQILNIYFHYFIQCIHYFIKTKIERIYTMYIDIIKIFNNNIPSVIDSNIFLILSVCSNLIWFKVFNINHINLKIISTIFNIYFFDILHLYD